LIAGLAASALSARAFPQEREAQSKEKQIETEPKARKEPGKALYGEKRALEDFSPTAQHEFPPDYWLPIGISAAGCRKIPRRSGITRRIQT